MLLLLLQLKVDSANPGLYSLRIFSEAGTAGIKPATGIPKTGKLSNFYCFYTGCQVRIACPDPSA